MLRSFFDCKRCLTTVVIKFFLKKTNSNLIKFNWENFGNEIGFFCGVFDDDISIKSEIENHYNLIENTKNLAVF